MLCGIAPWHSYSVDEHEVCTRFCKWILRHVSPQICDAHMLWGPDMSKSALMSKFNNVTWLLRRSTVIEVQAPEIFTRQRPDMLMII